MISAALGGGSHRIVRHLGELRIVDERKILGPGDVEEDLQAVLLGEIEKPFRRRVIDANAVAAEVNDLLKIALGLSGRRKRIAVGVRLERAVGNALHIELLITQAEEFAIAADTIGHRFGAALAPAARAYAR